MTFTRIFGFLIVVMGVCIYKSDAATTSGTTGGATTTPGGTTTPSTGGTTTPIIPTGGECTTTVQPVDCGPNEKESNFIYATCRFNEGNIHMTGYGSYSQSLIKQFTDCKGTTAVAFTGSGCGVGYCNSNTIVCTDASFFQGLGCGLNMPAGSYNCSYTPSGGIDVQNLVSYNVFRGCDAGFYKTSVCDPLKTSVGSGFYDSCAHCSGLSFESGRLQTYPNSGGSSSGNLYWNASNTDAYITSCHAYLKGTLTDVGGTFAISAEGCPYVL